MNSLLALFVCALIAFVTVESAPAVAENKVQESTETGQDELEKLSLEERLDLLNRLIRLQEQEEQELYAQPMNKRAQTFVRFGKRAQTFVRFGKRAQTFVRFGRSAPAMPEENM